MTQTTLRDIYLAWTRRALPAVLLPLMLTAGLQVASASAWWSAPAPDAGAMRYLFISVAVASVVVGRSVRTRETATLPLEAPALISLSWRLVVYAYAPVAIGAVLALMTRQMFDYYALLAVTLVGLAVLFPTFTQWIEWSRPADGEGP
ncbi:MAG: hypothetical protein JXP72_09715 [Coriobacteriia bacterium]|nr:hypothetical protein [Coriobacteriia bacterium]